MPGFPVPAIHHGNAWKCNYILMNVCVWNALHYPAGALPMSVVAPEEAHFQDNFNDIVTKSMRKEVEGSTGMPVGVQVISYPSNDEQVLYVMRQL